MKQRVRFVDAPPPIGGPQDPRAVWMQRLRLVTERPGEWAEVYSGTPSAVHQAANALRLRQYHVPPGGWQFTVRSFRRGHLALKREDHTVAVLYAKFTGEDGEWSSATAEYNHSADAVWDQHGRRICPECERNPLLVPEGGGSYPHACDECSRANAIANIEHGTEASYRKRGCRCPECREAARLSQRARIDKTRTMFLAETPPPADAEACEVCDGTGCPCLRSRDWWSMDLCDCGCSACGLNPRADTEPASTTTTATAVVSEKDRRWP